MPIKLAILTLLLASGVAASANAFAGGDKVKPALDADGVGLGSVSKQLQEGVHGSIGPSLPVIDDILGQGIKMPEAVDNTEAKEGAEQEKKDPPESNANPLSPP